MNEPLFLEDLHVGQSWTSYGRTVTQADIVTFAGMTGDFNPLHIDHAFAEATPFGRVIAHGLMGIAWAAGLSSMQPAIRTAAFVSVSEWRFLKPLFIGDTVQVITEVIELDAKPRKKHGRVVWLLTLINQRKESVQVGNFETLVYRRAASAVPSPHIKIEGSSESSNLPLHNKPTDRLN
jgi:3-hydroxybutyryl-CoA dehydratase